MDTWIDLTKPLDDSTKIYGQGSYRDPDFSVALWADCAVQGYEVWRLELGSQTGTHIDAPRHFNPTGVTIDELRPDECVGSYRLVAVDELLASTAVVAEENLTVRRNVSRLWTTRQGWNTASERTRSEKGHLSLTGSVTAIVLDVRVAGQSLTMPHESSIPQCPAKLTPEAVEAIATAPCRLIVVIGEANVDHPDPFYFPRRLAACEKFLVEDTREDVGELPREGQIIALPLYLTGLSGSPARVLIRGN